MKNLLHLLGLFLILALLPACYSVQNFQTAKPLEEGETQIGLGINGGRTFDFNVDDVDEDTDLSIPFSDMMVYSRYGITDKIDAGIRYGALSGNIYLDGKYNAINMDDRIFVSPGLELGSNLYLLGTTSHFQFDIPLHTSFFPSENFGLFVSPRMAFQMGEIAIFNEANFVTYFGFSGGLEVTFDQVKLIGGANWGTPIGVDFVSDDFNRNTFNIGIGLSFVFD